MAKYKTKLANFSCNILDDLLFLSSFIIIWSAIVYFVYRLDLIGLIISSFLAIASFLVTRQYWFRRRFSKNAAKLKRSLHNSHNEPKTLIGGNPKIINTILLIIYTILYILSLYWLFLARSDQALISPWQVVNTAFFLSYAGMIITLALLLGGRLRRSIKSALIGLFYLLTLTVAVIVYKLGYGFDPFIHQAAMSLIDKTGAIMPKTPYYLGAYGLIITLHKITWLSLNTLNKWLVPAMTAVFLPISIYRFLKNNPRDRFQANWLTVLFAPVIIFTPFISTTPQNLGYLFLILTVLAPFIYKTPAPAIFLALATAAIHPLTGLPALLFVAWFIYIKKYRHNLSSNIKNLASAGLFIISVIMLPLALVAAGGGSWSGLAGFWKRLGSSVYGIVGNPAMAGNHSVWLNFAYFLADNYSLIIIIALIIILLRYWQRWREDSKYKNAYDSLIIMAAALTISYFIGSQIDFRHLIAYEQSDYINRLPVMIFIFLFPLFLLTAAKMIKAIRWQSKPIRVAWLAFGVIGLTASLYISYPRYDNYFNSHGFSTSASDIKAVHLIDNNSSQPYTVLSDQQVSAAALQELGFDHYYQTKAGSVYFYPIPTGGPLYQYYLDMVYKQPSRKYIAEALKLSGTKLGYLVINKYWYQSPRLIKEAKLSADKWWSIDNGQDYVFQYKF